MLSHSLDESPSISRSFLFFKKLNNLARFLNCIRNFRIDGRCALKLTIIVLCIESDRNRSWNDGFCRKIRYFNEHQTL